LERFLIFSYRQINREKNVKPLIVLLATFLLASIGCKIFAGAWMPIFCGNLAMGLMLCFTSLGHFLFTRGMTLMLPAVIPFKREIVYVTGVLEALLGLALLLPSLRTWAGVALIAMFVAMLPANIHAALKRINYETGAYDGPGPRYLWFRVPEQILFVAWIFYFAL
jgi:uncharacterized membrane protein